MPRRGRVVQPPFWQVPIEYRLFVATGLIRAKAERLLAEGNAEGYVDLKKADAVIVGMIDCMLLRQPTLVDFLHELLDNRNREGVFQVPVLASAVGTITQMHPIEYAPTPSGPPRSITTPFFDLSADERLQVNAAFDIIMAAVLTHFYPARVAIDGSRDFNNPSDVVGVPRMPARRALDRGISYDTIVHVKAVAARVLNEMERIYGGPRDWATILLVEAVTKVKLTRKEIRVLWNNRRVELGIA
jgi:hypothetical protein